MLNNKVNWGQRPERRLAVGIQCKMMKLTGISLLVSWFFEPSQTQRITSGPNRNFTLSPSYSFHKSS